MDVPKGMYALFRSYGALASGQRNLAEPLPLLVEGFKPPCPHEPHIMNIAIFVYLRGD